MANRYVLFICVVLICLVSSAAAISAPLTHAGAAKDPLCSPAMRSDARLSDVCFVDQNNGWAVGDRGIIWHTSDGGEIWKQQRFGVPWRLESVHFIDVEHGWVAGGFVRPYTHTSTGVVLITDNGGQTWHHYCKLTLPGLKKIRFFTRRHGWAIGYGSAMYPAGVFLTDDGGRSWKPLTGIRTSGWMAGDMVDQNNGALAGRNGLAVAVRRGGIEAARIPAFGLRSLARLRLAAPVSGWLIGDDALVMTTSDLGTTWQSTSGDLPDGVVGHFDWKALAVIGQKCWVAGSPGTRVLYTENGGKMWDAFVTGQRLPIRAMTFVDDLNGWAVGELGLILTTKDGGRSWSRQRAGGNRVALLGLFGQPDDVPLELFASLSGNDGYLGAVDVLGRCDVEVPNTQRTHPSDRMHEALVNVGASATKVAWQFPLRQPGLGLGEQRIVDGWNRANDGAGLERLRAYVVRQIRMWRPDVIVTSNVSIRGDRPLDHLINQTVLEATRQAADPTSFIEQGTHAGLDPWTVKKIYSVLPAGERGTTEITTAKLASRFGQSLADVAAEARGLINDRFSASENTVGFQILVGDLLDTSEKDFFSGIVLQPGGGARRNIEQAVAENIDLMKRVAQRKRNMQAIIKRSEKDQFFGKQLIAQTDDLTRGLDSLGAGRVLYHLADQYRVSGNWPMAAETFSLLVEKYQKHPLRQPAMVWLLQYYASGEAGWRLSGSHILSAFASSAHSVDTLKQEGRSEQAAKIAGRLEREYPDLKAEPMIGFPMAIVHKRRGFSKQAERFYLAQRRRPTRDAWFDCAQAEEWIVRANGMPPKPLVRCVKTDAKPIIDGLLEEPIWSKAKPAQLESVQGDDGGWPAVVMLAYDDQFLYLAASCRKAPGVNYVARSNGPRSRDADLSENDRIEFLFDLDRDYVSYYRFSVDHCGWTRDECWTDSAWNPKWFVASTSKDDSWSVEAVIPLNQLTGRFPRPGDFWALGVQRVVPGLGFQSISNPASISVRPEGFGLLGFD